MPEKIRHTEDDSVLEGAIEAGAKAKERGDVDLQKSKMEKLHELLDEEKKDKDN